MYKKLKAADGHELDCWQIPASGTSKGGLVILQEIFGVTEQLKGVASKYAALGFDVSIPALFDRQSPSTVVPFAQAEKGRELMLGCLLDHTMTDISTAVEQLKSNNTAVCVMGFCWGGGLAVRSAQKLDVDGAIAFYPTRLSEYLDCPLQAPTLGHFGLEDSHVSMELLDQVVEHFPTLVVHKYEAGHAFANDAREQFVPNAAELAFDRSTDFLNDVVSVAS